MGCFGSKPDRYGGESKAATAQYMAEIVSSYGEVINQLAPHRVSPPTSQEASLALKEAVLNTPHLLLFVREYLKATVATLKLHAALTDRLHRACGGEPLLGVEEFGSVFGQLRSMASALQLRRPELDKKLGSLKAWSKAWRTIYNGVFILVLASTVVLAAVAAPPVTTAAATATSTAMKSMEQWLDALWSGHLDKLEGEREVVMAIMGDAWFHIDGAGDMILELVQVLVRTGSLPGNGVEEEEEAVRDEVVLFKKVITDMKKLLDSLVVEIQRALPRFLKAITE